MLILKKDDIKKCFTMRDAIEADKEALEIYSEGKAKVPLRTNIDIDEKNGQNLYMPAYVGGNQAAAGLKIVSVYPDNISKGLPSVPATVITLDADTGELGAVIEGTYLTQLRTGAVQGAATELLARKDAKVGALIGTGGQAATQLEAMIEVRDLEEIRIFDIDFSRAKKFAELMQINSIKIFIHVKLLKNVLKMPILLQQLLLQNVQLSMMNGLNQEHILMGLEHIRQKCVKYHVKQ